MTMYRILIVCLAILLICGEFCQKTARSPEQIRKEMADIRRSTDWSNEAAANKAQAKIEALSKEMLMAGQARQMQAAGIKADSARLNEDAEYKMGLWKQMLAAADQGEGGDILLAKLLREEIVEAYKNDESPIIKNPEIFEEQAYLCIDMSLPTVQRMIDQMDKFKSIKVLLITCNKAPVPVNLDDILNRAKNYPLEQLHIINFKHFVTRVPGSVGNFKNLQTLSLFNNQIDDLPVEMAFLSSLKKLYVDINPISTLFPEINTLQMLKELGVAKTNIPEDERLKLKKILANCNILEE